MALRSLGRNRLCQRRILLVPDETSASGCGRLPLGPASCRPPAGSAKSLRHAARTVSADCGVVRVPIRAAAARTGRRAILGNQFVSSGLRPHASWLYPAADFFCLPVLGWNPNRAMVPNHRRQRILPAVVACNHGQAAGGTTSLPHAPQLAWIARMPRGRDS